jgi:hypothetical protein
LNLDRRATARVLQTHRRNRGLLDTILEHGGDHVGYVEMKMAIMRAMGLD